MRVLMKGSGALKFMYNTGSRVSFQRIRERVFNRIIEVSLTQFK